MDLPLDITAIGLPLSENVVKLEPLSEADNIQEGVQQKHPYLHSSIVQNLARSLSSRSSPPPPLTTSSSIQPIQKMSTVTSSTGNQQAGVRYRADIEGDDGTHTPDSSQNLSQPPGPPNWSDSQQRSLVDSDAFYSSDSQPPSLKVIRLEFPSPTPESSLSQLVAQKDAQTPRRQDHESPLSLDVQTPRQQDHESPLATGESLLVAQMGAQLTPQQDPSSQNVTKEPSLVAQSQQQQFGSEQHYEVEHSPLSQLIAQMDAQSQQQQKRDPNCQNVAEGNHHMECSSSEGFLCDPPTLDGGEEEEREMEGERGRTREKGRGGRLVEPPVVGCEREESQGGVSSVGGRVSHDGHALHGVFGKFGGCKKKAGQWIKDNEAASGRDERSSLIGQSSKSVCRAAEKQSTSSGQRSSNDHNGGESLGDDVHGTVEVDVVGMGSQPLATLEVDVEGTDSLDNEMETTGAPPLTDTVQRTQVQQSAIEGTGRMVVEGSKERVERPRVKMKTKKMSLTIDKSKKNVQKKDSTGNITMETPRHSQPPFQPKQKSPELYSQEYLRSSTSNAPLGGNASSSRIKVGATSKDLSNFSDPMSKSTWSTTSSAVPSTSKAFTAQGDLSKNRNPKHSRDASLTQNNASNSNLLATKSQAILSSYDIKSQEPSDPFTRSNKSYNKSSRDLFELSNPSNSAAPSNSNSKAPVLTQGSRTRTNAPLSRGSTSPGKTKLPSEKRGVFTTQPSHQGIPTHSGPLHGTTPSLSSPSPSVSPPPEGSHSRSTTPSSSVRQTSPDFKPYRRVVDPVYHNDPQLERWRQLMQAHWFEVKMMKSRQPPTMAEKRSLKQFGLLDDHNQ